MTPDDIAEKLFRYQAAARARGAYTDCACPSEDEVAGAIAEACAAALRERDAELLDLLRDMLPMATRAWHDDLPKPGCAGPIDDGRSLSDSLRIAREGALLSRVRALLEEAGK